MDESINDKKDEYLGEMDRLLVWISLTDLENPSVVEKKFYPLWIHEIELFVAALKDFKL